MACTIAWLQGKGNTVAANKEELLVSLRTASEWLVDEGAKCDADSATMRHLKTICVATQQAVIIGDLPGLAAACRRYLKKHGLGGLA
jgi:hypothetical protein